MQNIGFSCWKTLLTAGGKPKFQLVENLGPQLVENLFFSWWKT